MKEYRKRFVQLNMFLIGMLLILMMAAIAFYMYCDYYQGLQTTMEQVVEPLDYFPEPAKEQTPLEMPEKEESPGGQIMERQKGIMTVFYTPGEGKTDILSQASVVEEAALEQILEAVIAEEDSFGTLVGQHVIYYRTGNGDPYKIALASDGYIRQSMLSLAGTLVIVWVIAMVCLLAVSVRFSKMAVRPMERAIQREKQFVADASHDLKTPLSVILANNSILMENPDVTVGSLQRWTLSTQNAAQKMQKLIGEMLTLADVERSDASPVTEMVDMASVVTKAALQLESVAYEKSIGLTTDIPEQLVIPANEDYLQRIATGLIENAIKYEPKGGEVRIRLTKEKHRVYLEVWNRNTVISEESLPYIFERFYRGDKSREGAAGGHGLGLAIVKEMAERLGGRVQAKSGAQDGTLFSAIFPAPGE